MTHSAWNLSGTYSALGNIRSVSAFVIFTLLMLALSRDLPAANEPSKEFRSTASTIRTAKDIEIETRILRALRRDPQLGPLNLGVHLSGGVAKLTGPVPTADLKQRAVGIVQKIDGVQTVNSRDLYISSAAQGRKRMSIVIQDDRPTQTRSASLPSPSNVSNALGESASPLPPSSTQIAVTQISPIVPGQRIALLAPEIAAPSRHAPEAACLTGNARPPSPHVSISVAIERLRKQDARYQQIRARVDGTTVYIVPGDTSGEDAMRFAQAVRRLAGVRHVIMDTGSR